MQRERGAKIASEQGLDIQISLVLSPVPRLIAERINERCEKLVLGRIWIPCDCQNAVISEREWGGGLHSM